PSGRGSRRLNPARDHRDRMEAENTHDGALRRAAEQARGRAGAPRIAQRGGDPPERAVLVGAPRSRLHALVHELPPSLVSSSLTRLSSARIRARSAASTSARSFTGTLSRWISSNSWIEISRARRGPAIYTASGITSPIITNLPTVRIRPA